MKTTFHKLLPFLLLLAGLVLSFACTRKESELNKLEKPDVKINNVSCDTISSLICIINNDSSLYEAIKILPYDTIFYSTPNQQTWNNLSFSYLGKTFLRLQDKKIKIPISGLKPFPDNSIWIYRFSLNENRNILKTYIFFYFGSVNLDTELECGNDGWKVKKQEEHIR